MHRTSRNKYSLKVPWPTFMYSQPRSQRTLCSSRRRVSFDFPYFSRKIEGDTICSQHFTFHIGTASLINFHLSILFDLQHNVFKHYLPGNNLKLNLNAINYRKSTQHRLQLPSNLKDFSNVNQSMIMSQ